MSSVVPEGWSIERLGKFCSSVRGVSYKPSELRFNSSVDTVTLLRSNNIQDLSLFFSNLQFVVKERVKNKQLLEAGDIAICMSNGSRRLVGKNGVFWKVDSSTVYTVGAFCSILRCKDETDKTFVPQLLKSDSFVQQVGISLAGSAINNLKDGDLEDYRFWFPPLPEQKKIASILTSVDEVIETTQRQIDKLQDLKKATMNELLTNGIGHTEFKDSELGRIPKSWGYSTIASACEIFNTLRLPISREEREKIRGDYPYYGPTGVLDYVNEFRLNGAYTLIGEDGDHFIKFREKPQTIYVDCKFNVNNHAHIIRGNEKVDTKWIYWFFLHRNIGVFLTRQGAGRYKLNKESLNRIPLSIPPLEEQRHIDRVLSSFDRDISSKSKKLRQTQSIKKSLMQDLLTGKVRVAVN